MPVLSIGASWLKLGQGMLFPANFSRFRTSKSDTNYQLRVFANPWPLTPPEQIFLAALSLV